MNAWIKRFLSPPVFENDDLKTRHAALLNAALIVTIVAMPIFYLNNAIGNPLPALRVDLYVVTVIAGLILRWWLYQGHVQLVAIAVMLISAGIITAFVATQGTIDTVTTTGYVLLVVTAGLLFDWQGIGAMVILSSMLLLGLLLSIITQPGADTSWGLNLWLNYTGVLVLAGGITYYSLHELRRALRRADQELDARHQVEAALRRQNRTLSSLQRMTLDIVKHQNVDELLTALAVRASELLDAPYGEIMVLEDEVLVTRATTANQAFLQGDRVSPHDARLSWQAVTTRAPAILDDYMTWPEHRAIYDRIEVHAVADFPILQGDRCLGVLAVGRDRPGYAFGAEQIQAGQLFAQLAALALDNAQLFASAQSELAVRRRAEESLRQSNAELQNRNEELDAFAHTVAHDIKNPLSIMINYADLLLDDYGTAPEGAVKQSLLALGEKGRKVNSIIEALLLFAGVRHQEVSIESLDMGHLVDEARQRLAEEIQASGADIRQPDRASWPVALGYASWVEEIWSNYLSNAIKYGGQPPQIELSAARQPNGLIRFNVRDNGAGLTPEQQARLFAPFERLEQSEISGHGLGLSIVRRIANKLGGQAGVESEPGQGSTFYFTLPAAPKSSP